jgi:hypothetical protein
MNIKNTLDDGGIVVDMKIFFLNSDNHRYEKICIRAEYQRIYLHGRNQQNFTVMNEGLISRLNGEF